MDRNEILTRLRERIAAFAASRIGRDAGEDLVQEVLIVLETRYRDVGSLEELLPLSLQILRFKMAAFHRKQYRRGAGRSVPVEEVDLYEAGADPEQLAGRQELLDRLREAIPKLGERCRELMRLKLLGRTFAEIAKELGAESLNTVYTWDARCRKQLLELAGGKWERR